MADKEAGSVQIRPATLRDINDIAAIEREVMAPVIYPAFFFRQALSIFGDGFLVAMRGGLPCGYLLVGKHKEDRAAAEIYSVAVAHKARGYGIGKALIDAALDWAKSNSVNTLSLTVSPENLVALSLYRAKGFKDVEQIEDYYAPGEARLVLRAEI